MNSKHNKTIGETLRTLREQKSLPLRKVASVLDIDQSYLSKIERGERVATKEQIIKLSKIFNVNRDELLVQYLSDKVVYELQGEELAKDVLKVAEKKLSYGQNEV